MCKNSQWLGAVNNCYKERYLKSYSDSSSGSDQTSTMFSLWRFHDSLKRVFTIHFNVSWKTSFNLGHNGIFQFTSSTGLTFNGTVMTRWGGKPQISVWRNIHLCGEVGCNTFELPTLNLKQSSQIYRTGPAHPHKLKSNFLLFR